jgi:HEAT repeat protein
MDINALVAQLEGYDPAEQLAAAQTLAMLGTKAQPAAVALVRSVGLSEDVGEFCAAALESMGPPAADQIPHLVAMADDCSSDVAYWAITLLGRAGPEAAAGVPALAKVLESDAELSVRERAAWTLGKIGPSANAAAAALRTAAESKEPRLARVAKQALEAVGG